ncbi:hypothetical protein DFH08DRAFT_805858 [Mycena albidolilacea]|uniref:Uncharacterized protein n=1 Tax=Mycena albidolilacea TaxID=1033008 RepID=A0AAD7A9L2_9AGAR|nr:hypothetical protein DFH08DRAFT_805858 [Mycena albidolilacea]
MDGVTAFEASLANSEQFFSLVPLLLIRSFLSTVWLYLFLLPFQLVSEFGWHTVPAVSIGAFTYLGFVAADEEIEQPFGYDENDLDLDMFCQDIIAQDIESLKSAPCLNAYLGPEEPELVRHRSMTLTEVTAHDEFENISDEETLEPQSPTALEQSPILSPLSRFSSSIQQDELQLSAEEEDPGVYRSQNPGLNSSCTERAKPRPQPHGGCCGTAPAEHAASSTAGVAIDAAFTMLAEEFGFPPQLYVSTSRATFLTRDAASPTTETSVLGKHAELTGAVLLPDAAESSGEWVRQRIKTVTRVEGALDNEERGMEGRWKRWAVERGERNDGAVGPTAVIVPTESAPSPTAAEARFWSPQRSW